MLLLLVMIAWLIDWSIVSGKDGKKRKNKKRDVNTRTKAGQGSDMDVFIDDVSTRTITNHSLNQYSVLSSQCITDSRLNRVDSVLLVCPMLHVQSSLN